MSADWLSRKSGWEADGQLNPEVFQAVVEKFGSSLVDFFATIDNWQLDRLFARTAGPEEEWAVASKSAVRFSTSGPSPFGTDQSEESAGRSACYNVSLDQASLVLRVAQSC